MMNDQKAMNQLRSRQGLTLVETIVSVAIFGMASAMLFSGVIYMARQQSTVAGQQRIEGNARRVMTEMLVDVADATGLSVETTSTQNRQRLIINKPDRIVAWQYTNGDNNDITIADNRLTRAEALTGNPLGDFEPQLEWVSPIGTNRVFQVDARTSSSRPLINVLARVGDRSWDRTTNQASSDDKLTGFGYQSYLIDFSLSKGDRVAP